MSFAAFALGGLVPTLAILAPLASWRVAMCVAVIVGLVLTGDLSARLGHGAPLAAIVRNVGGC